MKIKKFILRKLKLLILKNLKFNIKERKENSNKIIHENENLKIFIKDDKIENIELIEKRIVPYFKLKFSKIKKFKKLRKMKFMLKNEIDNENDWA